MPQMGVSVSEGTITKWLKQPGETIAQDEPLLEISTDKVDTEVPSPGEGVVAEILVGEGETVEVGTVLAVIAPAGAAVADVAASRGSRWLEPQAAPQRPSPQHPRPPAPEPAAAPAPAARSHKRLRGPRPRRRRATGRRSSRPSWRASPPSTASTRAGSGHGHGWPGDEEGHPRVHRVRRPAAAPRRPPPPAPSAPAAPLPAAPPQPRRRSPRSAPRRGRTSSRARRSSR